jgi:hypothetical protein
MSISEFHVSDETNRRQLIIDQFLTTLGDAVFGVKCPDCSVMVTFDKDDFPVTDYSHCEGPNQPLIEWIVE